MGRLFRGRVLKLQADHNNHMYVSLCHSGNISRKYIHRLVLEAFVGPCPNGAEGCHWDDNPLNNNLENLRWDTRSANRQDAVRNKHHWNSSKRYCKRGHEFTPENTYITTRGSRQCRKCSRSRYEESMIRRGSKPVISNHDKTHCPKGHEYTPENTYRDKLGRRSCILCQKIRYAACQKVTGTKVLINEVKDEDND